MKAADVLAAIHRHHDGAAIVHEVVLNDRKTVEAFCGFGSSRLGADDLFYRRIDALMVKSGQRTAIEVKVSRADYARETERKRAVWQAICHRFVYAVPAGLLTPEEVPDGIGLWEVYDSAPYVRVAKRAKVHSGPDPIPDQLFVAMCYRAMRNQRAVTEDARGTGKEAGRGQ